jgi:predicted glycogen debranching enzyme
VRVGCYRSGPGPVPDGAEVSVDISADLTFGPQVCGDLAAGGAREWLVPDGVGGYAMGTVSGLRTRRYHALQVVAGASPATRRVGLVALDPVLCLPGGRRIELGVNEWAGGIVNPTGHRFLARFDLVDGLPRWRWRVGDVVLERELACAHGAPALGVVYRLLAASAPVELAIDALLTWRDAHGERTAGGPEPVMRAASGGCVVEDAYRLSGPGWRPAGGWWRGAYLREEAERGLTAVEDLWHGGRFTAKLRPGEAMEISAWAGDLTSPPRPATELVAGARARTRSIVARAKPADATAATLARAADAFIVAGPDGPDVVAGYPWFGAWSRDTMISYEGLFLATGRPDEGRELLRGYAATLSEGMLANTADTGQTEYNTVDATLWFVHAVERHVTATGDTDFAEQVLPALTEVFSHHLKGTRFGIRAERDGLLTHGADGLALTWMDARVDGVPVTPRRGKPVEINALWVNALGAIAKLSRAVGRDPAPVEEVRTAAVASFARRFRILGGDRLYDVVDGLGGNDPSLRPNQLFAYSLPHAPLVPDRRVVAAAAAELLTPLGLRTLAPSLSGYRPLHRGGPAARDRAYHQGAVWPWLLGPFVDVFARVGNSRPMTRELLGSIDSHLAEWGLGSISETADGQPPHAATGCPFQAWSVAEIGRVRRKVG